MRRTELLIGAAAIIIASVTTTLYLVNQSRRAKQGSEPVIAMKEPDQVLSAKDLFGKSGSADSDTSSSQDQSNSIGAAAEPPSDPTAQKPTGTDATAPVAAIASKTIYPSWHTSDAHVEDARAVTDAAGYIAPVWSPVGLDIAFTREDRHAVYIAGAQPGNGARALINDANSGTDYTWNRDGMSLRVLSADKQYDQVLITGERYPAPNSPPRVFARDEKIFFVPSTRMGESREVVISGTEDRFSEPKLSPDESKVVYRGAETGLYIAAVDGSAIISIGSGTNASWLPDSTGIVYDQQVSDGRTVVDGDLWLATADGNTRSNLTNTPGIVELFPSVAPDGERIAFSAGGSIYVGKLVRPH